MPIPPPGSPDQTLSSDEDFPELGPELPPSPRRTPPPPPPGWVTQRTGNPPTSYIPQQPNFSRMQQQGVWRMLIRPFVSTWHPIRFQIQRQVYSSSPSSINLSLQLLPIINRSYSPICFSCVLEDPFPIFTMLSKLATAIFQVFLDHEWDINEPIPRANAPALA